MIKKLTQQVLNNCFLADALRKMAARSMVLGCMDAVQNPNAVLEEMGVQPSALAPEVELPPEQSPAPAPPPIALPRPGLLGLSNKPATEEPDRPGVPPKRVRSSRRRKPAADACNQPPAPSDDPPTSEVGS